MKYSPRRGQAYLLRDRNELGVERVLPSGLVLPATAHNPRDLTIHRGVVLKLGPPAWVSKAGGPTVPWGCTVGDTVFYVFALMREKDRVMADGIDEIVVVAQVEIQAVELDYTTDPYLMVTANDHRAIP